VLKPIARLIFVAILVAVFVDAAFDEDDDKDCDEDNRTTGTFPAIHTSVTRIIVALFCGARNGAVVVIDRNMTDS